MTQRRLAARRVPRAGGLLSRVPLDATAAARRYDQLYAWLRERIVDGSLVAGTRLASTRAFALDLGVSRFTVVTAFANLIAEGYVTTTTRGGGTFVARTLPEQMMRVRRSSSRAPQPHGRATSVSSASPAARLFPVRTLDAHRAAPMACVSARAARLR